jgi:glycosyltransferase involved in cell wall biosynthesis
LYEGFGLPILEAFALEVPVVTSNLSSMAEIAQEAAILVNPQSSAEIKKGILEAQAKRKNLIKAGKKRLELFSWEKLAEA